MKMESLKRKWRQLRESAQFRNTLVFLEFVAISAVLWFTFALNDSFQDSFDVEVKIVNVPDSVTFITDTPTGIHVSVHDKGTDLLRNGIMKTPVLTINFSEFASGGVMRFSKSDLYSALRGVFGNNASIASTSVDSLSLRYTTEPGKRVPIAVQWEAETASGFIVAGNPSLSQTSVLIYSDAATIDTVRRVVTKPVILRDLSETTTVEAAIMPIPDSKTIPSVVKVTIPVEPLVKKESKMLVTPINVPSGESVLLFPSQVDAVYYVPMSKFNEAPPQVVLTADYTFVTGRHTGRLPVKVGSHPAWCMNLKVVPDSVEYTIVR